MKLIDKDGNNRNVLFVVAALAGLCGSIVTILLALSAIWAAMSLAVRRFPFRIARSDLILAGAATLYVAVNLLTAFVNGPSWSLALKLVPVLLFLSAWLMAPRLRVSNTLALFDIFVLGSAFCAVLALPAALFEVLYWHERAYGGAGNPLPFAMICCLFGLTALVNVLHEAKWRQRLGWLGFWAAVVCLMLSQSKGLLPVMVLGFVGFCAAFRSRLGHYVNRGGLISAAIAVVVVAIAAIPFYPRLEIAAAFASGDAGSAQDASFSVRMTLWKHALQLAEARPLLGYGVQNRRDLIGQLGLEYTHFHNGYFTALVDAGLLGVASLVLLLVAPVVACLLAPADEWRSRRLFVACVLTATFAVGGLTNLIFWQDIYDSVFLWVGIVVVASVPVSRGNPLVFGKE